MEPTYQSIHEEALAAFRELLQAADTLRPGNIVVIGCSTSEVMGKCIGTASSVTAAAAIMDAVYPEIKKRDLYLAVQCCEHLNRSLVVERACLDRYQLQEVWVRPQLHAGGAFAMQAIERFAEPVMAEDLRARASAGMDIGGTLIGMHLHPVVVPVHAKQRSIGCAHINIARTRPKYVGGPRALYDETCGGQQSTAPAPDKTQFPDWLYEAQGDAFAPEKDSGNWGRDLFCAETREAMTKGENTDWQKYIGMDWD